MKFLHVSFVFYVQLLLFFDFFYFICCTLHVLVYEGGLQLCNYCPCSDDCHFQLLSVTVYQCDNF